MDYMVLSEARQKDSPRAASDMDEQDDAPKLEETIDGQEKQSNAPESYASASLNQDGQDPRRISQAEVKVNRPPYGIHQDDEENQIENIKYVTNEPE